MKKIILGLVSLLALTACPNQDEIKNMTDTLVEKRDTAIKFLDAKDYSLDGLLKIQEYFFDFSEKVHLIKIESEAQKNIQQLIKKKGVKSFCETFVLPTKYWEPLQHYCSNGAFYKCSPEIKEYKNTLTVLRDLAGANYKAALSNEPACN